MHHFSLIDDPWILVCGHDGAQCVTSISDLFSHQSEISCLAGETPRQDIAVLRLLTAIAYRAVATRVRPEEDPAALWAGL